MEIGRSGSSKLSTPGTTGAERNALAILQSVPLETGRPRRAAEIVPTLTADALARSVAFQPRRANSRSRRVGSIRVLTFSQYPAG